MSHNSTHTSRARRAHRQPTIIISNSLKATNHNNTRNYSTIKGTLLNNSKHFLRWNLSTRTCLKHNSLTTQESSFKSFVTSFQGIRFNAFWLSWKSSAPKGILICLHLCPLLSRVKSRRRKFGKASKENFRKRLK